MEESETYWFPAKRYGYGWGLPITWQGWTVVAAYGALVASGLVLFPPARDLPMFIVFTTILTAALVTICYFKGEPPSWHWGDK